MDSNQFLLSYLTTENTESKPDITSTRQLRMKAIFLFVLTDSSPRNVTLFFTLFLERIWNKGALKEIKNFRAQEANTVWNEFNHAVSSLVNTQIDHLCIIFDCIFPDNLH